MRLTTLEAYFVRYQARVEPKNFIVGDPATWRARGCPSERRIVKVHYTIKVETLAEAQGLQFLCPACFIKNNGSIGTHWCGVTFEGRGAQPEQGSQNKDGKPTRWTVSGTGLNDLTTRPSILLEGGCNWHGYITNGEVS